MTNQLLVDRLARKVRAAKAVYDSAQLAVEDNVDAQSRLLDTRRDARTAWDAARVDLLDAVERAG